MERGLQLVHGVHSTASGDLDGESAKVVWELSEMS